MTANTDTLLETIKSRLSTAQLGDVLDAMGRTHQFLPPGLAPLDRTHVMAGYAMTVLEADCAADTVGISGDAQAFGLMFKALDDLQHNEVYICTGGTPRYALWGELMTVRARELGAAGAVLDGYHRDTRGIEKQNFPVFSRGSYAQDQRVRGRVIDYRCPIEYANGARVNNRDIIVGDIDGVIAIPSDCAAEAVERALTKLNAEGDIRGMIEAGESTTAIFERTGIM